MKISAVILAAGTGSRLGGVAKALLAGTDGRTFLANIVATARAAGTDDIVVVVGPPHGEPVGAAARELGARVAVNPQPERGMASSVAIGFAALQACDAAWLWPVDHPSVATATLRTLLLARMNHDAARPVYQGRGGHPPLIGKALFPRLAGCGDVDGGARAVLAAADTVNVDVDDRGCVLDVDTPADRGAL